LHIRASCAPLRTGGWGFKCTKQRESVRASQALYASKTLPTLAALGAHSHAGTVLLTTLGAHSPGGFTVLPLLIAHSPGASTVLPLLIAHSPGASLVHPLLGSAQDPPCGPWGWDPTDV
jgi:hypothetical protein